MSSDQNERFMHGTAMAGQRFAMRQERDGSWTIYGVKTGHPVIVNGVLQVGLNVDAADDMVDVLNGLVPRPETPDRFVG